MMKSLLFLSTFAVSTTLGFNHGRRDTDSSSSADFNRQQPLHGLTTNAALFAQQNFDFIVIGGGTGGLALAVRLSENSDVRVGVIEAGDPKLNDPLVDTPGLGGVALFNPAYDWIFASTPQAKLNGRSTTMNRGKMLGGTSALNIMAWQRASKDDYDAWATLGAGSSWNFNSLLPWFMKTESVHTGPLNVFPGITTRGGSVSSVEGSQGPVQVSFNNFYTDLTAPFVSAISSLGIPMNNNPDGGNATGLFNAPHSVNPATGTRSYSTTAYFLPNQARTNLVVLTGAQVSKVNFANGYNRDGTSTATGVNFIVGGKTFTASACKEVIVSAGSIQTPQILELSGIGGSALLKSLKIPVVVDLPGVGENLQDHAAILTEFSLKSLDTIALDKLVTDPVFAAAQQTLYQTAHTGAFTNTVNAFSFNPLQTWFNKTEFSTLITNLKAEIKAAKLNSFQTKQANINLDLITAGKVGQIELILLPSSLPGGATPGQNRMTILSFQSRPFSRGSVHINTTNPLAHPLFNPNYLSYTFDREVMVKTAQVARQITQTKPLSNFVAGPVSPGPDVKTKAQFQDFVLGDLTTEWHPIGTASLGARSDGGVVDENLLVYGTSNLRVVDASVFPLHIASHPQQTIYAIAERAAQQILSCY